MVKICILLAPSVLDASISVLSIFSTPNMAFVRRGKNIPMNTTSGGPILYPNERMKIGAHAIGAIGLRTSMIGVRNSFRGLTKPRKRPRGTAIRKAIANPSRNVENDFCQ